jgi:hypothetical protein
VRDADHRDVLLLGQLCQRRQNAPHICSLSAVDLADAEVGAHRIDDDKHDIADALDRALQQRQIGDQAKRLILAGDACAVTAVMPPPQTRA